MFMAIGCDTLTRFSDSKSYRLSTGCISVCSSNTINEIPINFTQEIADCSGIGCCQTSVPKPLQSLTINLSSFNYHSDQLDSNPRSYGFLAEQTWFRNHSRLFSLKDTPEKHKYYNAVIDWAIGNKTCEQAIREGGGGNDEYMCGLHTTCNISDHGYGYRCLRKEGYKGNPYTKQGCTAIGGGVLLSTLVLTLCWIYKKKILERNHRKNGGLLLEHLSVKSFKEAQLEKATNYLDAWRLLGQGGNGWVYKGSLADMFDIAVKKSKVVDQNQIEQFANEAEIVAKLNHKNVVKLLGFCLESKVPMLVYDCVPNGTLSHHIQTSSSRILSSWRFCLRIVAETAQALTGELTIKSDVYGFGVVLMELISKQKPVSQGQTGEMINLVHAFTSAAEDNQLDQVLKVGVANERETEQVNMVTKLAVRCVAMPRIRPTRTEVAVMLNGLVKKYHSFHIEGSGHGDELESLLIDQEVVTITVYSDLE
ncbi:hypothetical protein AQUCO_03500114v1 [Aquilegia coerulea]|uniref:Protein kinase domain-containing protein n=1 Tax=Aquilegia coerulea TaxID=218851 RepID=A0A2G5CW87_AQUCA|nr:hypothetical protein AQUCO_03500114v1 [Aquilegia coerulea]